MFLGMTAALWMHWIVLRFKIPFPGYYHKMEGYTPIPGEDAVAEPEPIPVWVYFLLIIPSMFDLAATALCMYGLRYVDVSIYQMLRGELTHGFQLTVTFTRFLCFDNLLREPCAYFIISRMSTLHI